MGDEFTYLLLGLGFGIVLFYEGMVSYKRKKLIENTPTSKIRSIAMGLVEIFGKVVPAQKSILKSPLSNKDCVYYKFSIEEQRGSGKNRRWVTISKAENMVKFFVQDETGVVLVDPQGAQIEIPEDFKFESGWGKDPPANILKYLDNRKIMHDGWFGINKNMKFREFYIAPNDNLFVMGTAGDNPYVEEASGKESSADIMIQKGNSKNYYISDKAEKEILKSLQLKVFLGFIVGSLLILGCLAAILFEMGLML